MHIGSSYCGSVVMSPTSIHEDMGLISGPAQWAKDPLLLGGQCRSQLQLGSGVAVAVT